MTTFALPFGFSFNPNSMHTVTFSTFYVVKFQGNFLRERVNKKRMISVLLSRTRFVKFERGSTREVNIVITLL